MEIIGGPPTPGMGWAAGVERILLSSPPPPVAQPPLDLYVAYAGARARGRRVPARRRRAPRRPRRAARARGPLAQGPAQAGRPRRRPLRCDPGRGGDLPQGHGERGAEDGGARHGDAPHPQRSPVRPPRANQYRDAWCGELRAGDVDSTVRVAGWVHRRRDHGGLIFIDLRDRSGIVQLVFHPETAADAHALAERLRPEHVVSASGRVVRREEGNVNPKLDTGEIELEVDRGRDAGGVARPRRSRSTRRARRRAAAAAPPRHRPAPRGHAARDDPPPHGQPRDPRLPQRARLPRDGDADHDALHARGRARLPRPLAHEPGRVLRAAAVAAAVQADADDERLRALLPDRPLLPRRGPARRPPARVHPARPRDELRRRGGRDRDDRGDDGARLRGDRLPGRARRRGRA